MGIEQRKRVWYEVLESQFSPIFPVVAKKAGFFKLWWLVMMNWLFLGNVTCPLAFVVHAKNRSSPTSVTWGITAQNHTEGLFSWKTTLTSTSLLLQGKWEFELTHYRENESWFWVFLLFFFYVFRIHFLFFNCKIFSRPAGSVDGQTKLPGTKMCPTPPFLMPKRAFK